MRPAPSNALKVTQAYPSHRPIVATQGWLESYESTLPHLGWVASFASGAGCCRLAWRMTFADQPHSDFLLVGEIKEPLALLSLILLIIVTAAWLVVTSGEHAIQGAWVNGK